MQQAHSHRGALRLQQLGMSGTQQPPRGSSVAADGAAAQGASADAIGGAQENAADLGPVVQYVVIRKDLREEKGWPLVRPLSLPRRPFATRTKVTDKNPEFNLYF